MLELLQKAKEGFGTLDIDEKYQQGALKFIEKWLTEDEFSDYQPQIQHLIESGHWDYLLDCFYQVIPFGTGGRRGEVGVGPNRINPWTIRASAQGHSQYLIKEHGQEAKDRGVVLAYDVREFFGNAYLSADLPNPVQNMKCEDIAKSAAEVYAANEIQVYIFDSFRTTPELSFAIRHLGAIGGDVFSASHNPPEHNGKKVYDLHGGQLIPPHDERLVDEVVNNVSEVKTVSFDEAVEEGKITIIGEEVDTAYIEAASELSLSESRDINIAYTPLHGCGSTSVARVLKHIGFEIQEDPKTSNPSGKFENVTFNIPNPEVIQSFETPLEFAREIGADVLLNSDPDADRIGIMFVHEGEWTFINGNEIGIILSEFVLQKRKGTFKEKGVFIKTTVTTDLIKKMAEVNDCDIVGDLLVGFKYIGEEMNKLEAQGRIEDLILASEESHGYLAGDYARDKDAVVAAIWLCELAAEQKEKGASLLDFLNETYKKYGFYRNYLAEIRMLGATGVDKIRKIQSTLRETKPQQFGKYKTISFEDCLDRLPIVSETDASSKNVLIFHLDPPQGYEHIKVTVRPSGTEPKIKMYFEIGTKPIENAEVEDIKKQTEELVKDIEKDFMDACYQILDVDFPERGYLLFWQLPLDVKLKYFEIESEIEGLRNTEQQTRKASLENLLSFLGANPIEKVDAAFTKKNQQGIRAFLEID